MFTYPVKFLSLYRMNWHQILNKLHTLSSYRTLWLVELLIVRRAKWPYRYDKATDPGSAASQWKAKSGTTTVKNQFDDGEYSTETNYSDFQPIWSRWQNQPPASSQPNNVVNNYSGKVLVKIVCHLANSCSVFGDNWADCLSFLVHATRIWGREVINLLYRLLGNVTMETDAADLTDVFMWLLIDLM